MQPHCTLPENMQMKKTQNTTKNSTRRQGLWIMIVAAVILEAISCTMYFTSRAAIRHEAEQRAKTELRKAELEIELHTIDAETAAKALALLVQKHLDSPEAIFDDTRLAVQTLRANTSLAVAFVPDYFPGQRFYEACSSRFSEDSIFTRNIGSAEHDYTLMEWYQDGFVHDSCWWSEPYLDDSGSQTMVVSCSYPVKNTKDEVIAVVCVDLSLDYLESLSENLQVYPNSSYSIRSNKGLDIVSAVDTADGGKYIPFSEEIDATGWHIEIIIPENELFRDLNRIGKIVGILMLLGLAILALIVIYSARMTQKMVAYAEKNKRMEGELEVAQTIQKAMLPKVFPPFADRPENRSRVGLKNYDTVRQSLVIRNVGVVGGHVIAADVAFLTGAALLAADTETFNAYKAEKAAELDVLAEAGDSTACQSLIANAKAEINALAFDTSKSLDENKATVDTEKGAIETILSQSLAMQRAAEAMAADKAAFEAYKADKAAALDSLAEAGDSAASQALIAGAKAAVTGLAFDESKSLDENKTAADAAAAAVKAQLTADLEAQRAAEAETPQPEEPGDQGEGGSSGDGGNFFTRLWNRIRDFFARIAAFFRNLFRR